MYNKEVLRKELEDCWDEGLAVGWENGRNGHSRRPNRATYITTRLAALDALPVADGDDWSNQYRSNELRGFDGEGEKVVTRPKSKADILRELFKDDFLEFKQKSGAFVLVVEAMDAYANQIDNSKNDYGLNELKLVEQYADNGAFSHYELIDLDTGKIVWPLLPSAVTGGVKWVKASERIPMEKAHWNTKKENQFPVRMNGRYSMGEIFDQRLIGEPEKLSIYFDGEHHF